MDIADYSASTGAITVSLAGSSAPVFTVDDGSPETLYGIEVLIGSDHGDTLVVGALGAAGAAAIVLVDLGGGDDMIEIAAAGTSRIDGESGWLRLGDGGGFAYAGVERIEGGTDGSLVYGGAAEAHYVGGGGVNYLEGGGAGTVLESTSGDSWIVARDGATVISGAGNDLIEAQGTAPVTIVFGRGSGHDMLGSHFSGRMLSPAEPGGLPTLEQREALRDRLGDTILLDGLTSGDLELIWEWEDHLAPLDALGLHDPVTVRIGPAAIRITDTGETLHLGTLAGTWIDGEFCILLIGTSEWDLVLDFYDGEGAGYEAFTADYDLFGFGTSSRYSLLDLFAPETLISTPLDSAWSAAEGLLAALGTESGAIVGTQDGDYVIGTAGSDDMFGGSGDDVLEDGDGDDFVRGGFGMDVFAAGAGDDDLDGGDDMDFLDYGAATTSVTVDLAAGTASSSEFGSDRLASIEEVAGGSGDDSLAGTAGANRLIGGSGDDFLAGRGGDDAYVYSRSWQEGVGFVGDAGDDVIEDSGGTDRLELYWLNVDDVTVSLAPDDSYLLSFAGGGSVTIAGGALAANAIEEVAFGDAHWWSGEILTAMANPVVETLGTAGADAIDGTDGRRNRLVGLDGDDSLEGRGAPDLLEGGDGADLLAGLGGDDVLEGGAGADTLDGGDGRDTLHGGDGADLIIGGHNRDLLTGGGGADTFRFGHTDGGHGAFADRIADFTPGTDLIDLSQMDADPGQSGRQAFTFIGSAAFSGTPGEVRVETRDGDTWVLIDGHGGATASIEIAMTGTVSITGADFIL
ncbi:MAG TPA: calcium-binding protein [Allosphingosinicella sp.]|nr:calcium-binding protein [Allosphingosinicella sp.]